MKNDQSDPGTEVVYRVCSRGFAPAETALRDGDGMVHLDCAAPSAAPGFQEDLR
jgi:hypothetical protein